MDEICIFISYSHSDIEFKEQLEKRLLDQNFRLKHDGLILPGDDWRLKVATYIFDSEVILLLVSETFKRSPRTKIEVEQAMAQRRRGESIVIPVRLARIKFDDTPYKNLVAIPRVPLADAADEEAAWKGILTGIRNAVRGRRRLTNHLLIPDTSPFSNALRDRLVQSWETLRIGGRFRYKFKDYKESRNKRVGPSKRKPVGDSALYVKDYRDGLRKFLDQDQTCNCLFTIYPEEKEQTLTGEEEQELVQTLLAKKKRMICFESGQRLLKRVPEGHLSPICVIHTKYGAGARKILRRFVLPFVSKGPYAHIILLPGPACEVMEQRWREYRNFLTRVHLAHEGVGDTGYCASTAGEVYADAAATLGSRPVVRVTAHGFPATWLPKEASLAAERLIKECQLKYESFATCFICGNDEMALAVMEQVRDAGGETAIKERKVAFVGFDGITAMTKMLDHGVEGTTVVADLDAMSSLAAQLHTLEAFDERLHPVEGRLYPQEVRAAVR